MRSAGRGPVISDSDFLFRINPLGEINYLDHYFRILLGRLLLYCFSLCFRLLELRAYEGRIYIGS
jgi:hypothetical protein